MSELYDDDAPSLSSVPEVKQVFRILFINSPGRAADLEIQI